MKNLLSLFFALLLPLTLMAEDWETIKSSGQYYWGVGEGDTKEAAQKMAINELVNMIAVNVSSDFVGIELDDGSGNDDDHQSRVLSCVRTYSQATLTNVETWVVSTEPSFTVRCYIRRSEMQRIYDARLDMARDMVALADEALSKAKVDMALQYYYWAYSLVRSVQRPYEAKDGAGHVLMSWLPGRIGDVLSDVSVAFERRDGDDVDLLFSYRGKPVSSLEFTYSDGVTELSGSAKDGRGSLC